MLPRRLTLRGGGAERRQGIGADVMPDSSARFAPFARHTQRAEEFENDFTSPARFHGKPEALSVRKIERWAGKKRIRRGAGGPGRTTDMRDAQALARSVAGFAALAVSPAMAST
jgi:hypothetical protein